MDTLGTTRAWDEYPDLHPSLSSAPLPHLVRSPLPLAQTTLLPPLRPATHRPSRFKITPILPSSPEQAPAEASRSAPPARRFAAKRQQMPEAPSSARSVSRSSLPRSCEPPPRPESTPPSVLTVTDLDEMRARSAAALAQVRRAHLRQYGSPVGTQRSQRHGTASKIMVASDAASPDRTPIGTPVEQLPALPESSPSTHEGANLHATIAKSRFRAAKNKLRAVHNWKMCLRRNTQTWQQRRAAAFETTPLTLQQYAHASPTHARAHPKLADLDPGVPPEGDRLRDKVPVWWTPPKAVLDAVCTAADSFDRRQRQRCIAANRIRLSVLTPRASTASEGGTRAAAGDATADDLVATGEWTSPTASDARVDAVYDCFANRYIPPTVKLQNTSKSLEWTRPTWWRNADGSVGSPPARFKGLGERFPDANAANLNEAIKLAQSGAAVVRGRGVKQVGGGLSDGEAGAAGVVAGVRSSLDTPATRSAPPVLSMVLSGENTHSDVFNAITRELDSASAHVTALTLIRTDGDTREKFSLRRDGTDVLQDWPRWAMDGNFELYAMMEKTKPQDSAHGKAARRRVKRANDANANIGRGDGSEAGNTGGSVAGSTGAAAGGTRAGGIGAGVSGAGGANGVTAAVRTSLDDASTSGNPPDLSLLLFGDDTHADIFASVAQELNSSSSRVREVTLRRLDGDAEPIVLRADVSDALQGWPEWALNGQFELFATMEESDGGGVSVGGRKRGGGRNKTRSPTASDGYDDGTRGGEMSELEALLAGDAERETAKVEEAIARGDRDWIGSIWAARVEDSSSGDFFDNETVYKKRFDREWNDQRELLSMMSPPLAGDGELGDLQAVLWDCDDMLLLIFDYYASLNGDGRISSMTFNEWGMFLDDFDLPESNNSKFANRSDLDRVFIAVDTKASHMAKAAAEEAAKAGKKAAPDNDEKKALTRVEFFTAIMQVAVAKLVKPGKASSLPEGLHKLCVDHIEPLINWDIFPDPNLFRRACYVGAVSNELAEHEESLRVLHAELCEAEFGAYAKRLGSKTWLRFLKSIQFIVGVDLSERDCNLCFVWSRMAVAGAPGLKDDCLPFEGFLEAIVRTFPLNIRDDFVPVASQKPTYARRLIAIASSQCRVAAIKALPTDDEILEKGCEDAGQWVLLMNEDDDDRQVYEQMLEDREVGWGGKPSQPLERCVAHTLAIILRSIENQIYHGTTQATKSQSNMEITAVEADKFVQHAKISGAR